MTGNPCPGLGQAQICGSQWGTTPLLINESQMEMQTIKKLHRFTSLQKPQILSQKQMTT